MVPRPVSTALGAGGIYHDLQRFPGTDPKTCTFEVYMMPPYGFIM